MDCNRSKSANLIDDMQDLTKENTYDSCLVSSERNNNNEKEIKKKKVKFSGKIVFIDVECWKKYNAEQTADENYDGINEEDNNEEENKKEKKDDKSKNNQRRNKKDNVFCTCNVI